MIDISRPLGTTTAAWPGDSEFQIEWPLHLSRGDNVSVSRISFSPHVGTHVDAPAHYKRDGGTSVDFDLHAFLGAVRVIDARGASVVGMDLLVEREALGAARLLVRSLRETRVEEFVEEFPSLTQDAATALVEAGLVLYGTDAPSVDPVDSARMSAHHILGGAGIPILENLDLSAVDPGDYDLLALPLRLVETEAAPLRAVLLPVGSLSL